MINAKEILNEAMLIKNEIVENRRHIHMAPEVGRNLVNTMSFIKEKLEEMGYETKKVYPSSLMTMIKGKENGKTILLRSDSDALPMKEKTNLPFLSKNNAMHSCGHDMHTAMLLGASKILKKHQDEIKGNVKILFQDDEEGFTGAKDAIKDGILENPKVDYALSLHVHSGTPSGVFILNSGNAMSGCTLFRIIVHGKGCHGAMPETGVDPISIMSRICTSLDEIITREFSALDSIILTLGSFHSGSAPNIIPEEAVVEGTIRSFSEEKSEKVFKRIDEISRKIAEAFRGSSKTEILSSSPPLINNKEKMDKVEEYLKDLYGEKMIYKIEKGGMGSEDFSSITQLVPSSYILLGAGSEKENPLYGKPMHNECVVFNEDVLPLGSACEAYIALKYLDEK